uniref:C-type lectin domain-containing protein n=1 Tax=Dicentrarchus labrax TaxID=13489 RepID=A0A8C4DKZ2_DICLA
KTFETLNTRNQIGSIYTCEVENCCLCLIVSAALRFKLVHLKVPAASKSHKYKHSSLYCDQFKHKPHDPRPKCEHGWEQYGRQCYYFSIDLLTWSKSRDECRQKGGDLVQIDSREEQVKHTALKLREKNNFEWDVFWIGLTDSEKEGTWLWVDGSPLNERFDYNWTGNDPDGADCVRMGKKAGAPDMKRWFDESCKYTYRSICEKPAETRHFTLHCV